MVEQLLFLEHNNACRRETQASLRSPFLIPAVDLAAYVCQHSCLPPRRTAHRLPAETGESSITISSFHHCLGAVEASQPVSTKRSSSQQ